MPFSRARSTLKSSPGGHSLSRQQRRIKANGVMVGGFCVQARNRLDLRLQKSPRRHLVQSESLQALQIRPTPNTTGHPARSGAPRAQTAHFMTHDFHHSPNHRNDFSFKPQFSSMLLVACVTASDPGRPHYRSAQYFILLCSTLAQNRGRLQGLR